MESANPLIEANQQARKRLEVISSNLYTVEKLTVLVFRENSVWVGQCLEYDINVCSKQNKEIFTEFETYLVSYFAIKKELGHELSLKDLTSPPDLYIKKSKEAGPWYVERMYRGVHENNLKNVVFKVKYILYPNIN